MFNFSEDAAKSDSKEVGAGEGGVAATPDQGYETDMVSTPVTVALETPLVSDTPITADCSGVVGSNETPKPNTR